MILFSILIPAVVALVIVLLAFRALPAALAERHGVAMALAGAFFVGYWLLPEWAPLQPVQYWHWLPYLGGGAWLAAGVSAGKERYWNERAAVFCLAAVICAVFIVPTWSDLEPSHTVYVWSLSLYLGLIALLLVHLPDAIPGTDLLLSLSASALATGLSVAVAVSITFGQLGIIAAAAMCGCTAGWLIAKRVLGPSAARNVALPYAILIGGTAFIGHINPVPPMRGLLWAPAAPLLLWLTVFGPLARLGGWKASAVRLGLVMIALAACAIPLF